MKDVQPQKVQTVKAVPKQTDVPLAKVPRRKANSVADYYVKNSKDRKERLPKAPQNSTNQITLHGMTKADAATVKLTTCE